MISAIVYNSYSGHTKKYAEMLSELIGLPIFSIDDAKKLLKKNTEIIYLSWIKSDKLTKFSQVNRHFNIKIVGAIGLKDYSDAEKLNFIGKNNISAKVFFLKGGIDLKKLSDKYKSKVLAYAHKLKNKLSKTGNCTTKNYELVAILERGGSYLSKNNLTGIVSLYRKLQ